MRCARTGIGVFALLLILGSAAITSAKDEVGTYAGKDAHWWIQQLKDPDGARAAQVALKKIGAPAVEPLAQLLASPDRRMRRSAAHALKGMRTDLAPIMPQLVAALASRDIPLTKAVLPLLHGIGPAVAAHLDEIAPLVQSDDRDLASSALRLLQMLKSEAREALPLILAVAWDGQPRLRLSALSSAIAIAPDAEAIVLVAHSLFARSNDSERRALLQVLRKLRPEVSGFDELVTAAAEDPVPRVREQAAALLGPIVLEKPERLTALTALLGDSDHSVRIRAAHSVGHLGSRAASTVPALEHILKDPDGTAHTAAIRALALIGPPAEHAWLLVLSAFDRVDPPRDLRNAVASYIVSQPELTLKALDHEEARVRDIAFRHVTSWTLEHWRGALPRLIGPVQAALATTAQPTTYESRALDTLGRLAVDHPEALQALLALRVARSEKVRAHAARALGSKPAHVDLLLELLQGTDLTERAFAEQALVLPVRTNGLALQAPLLRLMGHEDPDVRDRAGRLYVRYGGYVDLRKLSAPEAELIAATCARMIEHGEGRSEAISRLGALGHFALPHASVLLALLGDPKAGAAPAWALAGMAHTSDEARTHLDPILLGCLKGDDPLVAARAALAVGALASHDDVLLAHLPALMRNEDVNTYYAAVEAALHLGQRALPLLDVLIELVYSPTPRTHVALNAVSALMRIAPDDVRVIRVCLASLADPGRQGNANAYLGTLMAGGENSVKLVADALADSKARTQIQLLQVLQHYRLRASSVRDRVRPLLESPDARVSRAAKQTLEALGS